MISYLEHRLASMNMYLFFKCQFRSCVPISHVPDIEPSLTATLRSVTRRFFGTAPLSVSLSGKTAKATAAVKRSSAASTPAIDARATPSQIRVSQNIIPFLRLVYAAAGHCVEAASVADLQWCVLRVLLAFNIARIACFQYLF